MSSSPSVKITHAVPKLTKAQWAMLDKICRTNGGGIAVHAGSAEGNRVMRLHDMGLVQGKRGNQGYAVHTADGMALWRSQG